MKYLVLVLLIFESCKSKKIEPSPKPEYPKDIVLKINSMGYNSDEEKDTSLGRILLIDSCEYIFLERGGNGGPILTHKGNCKNPFHSR